MPDETIQSKTCGTPVGDPRWQLVERIVASAYFAKSDRLRTLLVYICEISLQGRDGELNEINIGSQLFGRSGYDPSVDGIVRSHASRMRQRLEQYFEKEGSQEPIRLLVPKGAYIPIFEPRSPEKQALELAPAEAMHPEISPARPADKAKTSSAPNHLPKHSIVWLLSAALALSIGIIVYLTIRLDTGASAQQISAAPDAFWSMFFAQGRPTTVVFSDASLALLQDITDRSVKLPDYVDSTYLSRITTPAAAITEVAKELGARRFTSIVDAGILAQFYRLPGVHPDGVRIRYSRDLRPGDLKDGSLVLLGTRESNPWVEIFETHMNFVFRSDLPRRGFSVINRSPRGNELAQYDFDPLDPSGKVYGVAALRPNLSASGYVLLLEGTSAAGTDAAADFIFNNAQLLPFLSGIRNPNGSIPYFEVLLQSNNVNGDASQLKIVACRTSQN
jgi:hypothetical protein